eukprot:TRINITY_DN4764_c0_g1_i4.p1 TRINITY_DN4764_c0_g1~~TRINITY_DN4764_c0_g1_i4.p1  ORF type:complete len:494 (-),score=93.11 TRINITY_DN4764_c0_g1_i4:915-2396(-)
MVSLGDASRSVKVCVLILASLQIGLTAGIVMGWPAFQRLLIDNNVYSNLCTEGQAPCNAQVLQMNSIYDAGIFANTGSPVLTGVILDRFGPKRTNIISSILFIAGCAVLSCALKFGMNIYAVGYGLLGFSGPGIYVSLFHLCNLVPEYQGSVLSGFSGIFTISSFVFNLFEIVLSRGLFSLSLMSLFLVFAVCLSPLLLIGWFIWPHAPIGAQTPETEPLLANVNDEYHDLSSGKHHLSTLPLVEQVRSPLFWLMTLWILAGSFPGVFFSGTVDVMFVGDQKYLSTLFNYIWALGFVCVPLLGLVIDKTGMHVALIITTTIMLSFCTLAIFATQSPILAIICFVCASVGTVFHWGCFYSYIGKTFGFVSMGKIVGINSLFVAASTLLQYPLLWLTFNKFSGNFAIPSIFVLCGASPILILPIYYTRWHYKRVFHLSRLRWKYMYYEPPVQSSHGNYPGASTVSQSPTHDPHRSQIYMPQGRTSPLLINDSDDA